MPIETIKQRSVTLQIEGGATITVRRLRHKAARAFLRQLADVLVALYGAGGGATLSLSSLSTQLPALIAQSEDLAQSLVLGSTDLNAEQFAELDILAASTVLRAALEINLDDELKNCWAGIVAIVAAAIPGSNKRTTTSPSAPSTPTSSMPASPPST